MKERNQWQCFSMTVNEKRCCEAERVCSGRGTIGIESGVRCLAITLTRHHEVKVKLKVAASLGSVQFCKNSGRLKILPTQTKPVEAGYKD